MSDADIDAESADDDAVLETRLQLVEEENRRLREEYARSKRVSYRRSAAAFGALGVLAGLLGVAFADARTVLFALAGTGVFAGVLTYYLTPEHVVPVTVGERAFSALAENEADIARELGLTDHRYYVPVEHPDAGARLFVPQHATARRPDDDALATVFVATDDDRERGVSLHASGDRLFEEYERARTTSADGDPERLGESLVDALANQFELVESGDVEQVGDGRLAVALSGVEFGPGETFDHPVASFLAVGVARDCGEAVALRVTDGGERADERVVLDWPAFEADEATGGRRE
ncbi:hypothetical protein GCM10009037_30420 [Halarchaeum grantii]|uniref:DUF7982 domain-containing protein n=1 Tax=Halarchaeum grantii TaxID=1193105 RepID=A0A830FE95_9EURY|nr:hypothetical protein [Halarchaeum grantii]GGL44929.1 hypothetical protein GCM10009037_30420 [Halarchaeum grantii]